MASYLLDTDAIIDFLAGIASSVSMIQDIHDRGDLLCTSDVVIAEVYAGLKPEHRDKGHELLAACHFLPTAPEEAMKAGTWRYDYARRGITLSTTDVLVAATAYAHKATIITANTDDYPMDEVAVLALPRVKR